MEIYVGEDGETVVEKSKAHGMVTAVIPVGTPNKAILNLTKCNQLAVNAERIADSQEREAAIQSRLNALESKRAELNELKARTLKGLVSAGLVKDDDSKIELMAKSVPLTEFTDNLLQRNLDTTNNDSNRSELEKFHDSIREIENIENDIRQQNELRKLLNEDLNSIYRKLRSGTSINRNYDLPSLPASRTRSGIGRSIIQDVLLQDALTPPPQ